jgi:hypothetical protein
MVHIPLWELRPLIQERTADHYIILPHIRGLDGKGRTSTGWWGVKVILIRCVKSVWFLDEE